MEWRVGEVVAMEYGDGGDVEGGGEREERGKEKKRKHVKKGCRWQRNSREGGGGMGLKKKIKIKKKKRQDLPELAARGWSSGTAAAAAGLPARLRVGLPGLLVGLESLSLMRLRVPSLVSPPEPAPSPSLPEAAVPGPRGRLSGREGIAAGALRSGCCWVWEGGRGAEEGGGGFGDRGREGGPLGVEMPLWRDEPRPCCFFFFFRVDSLPLASERLGEPGRLSEPEDAVRSRELACLLGRWEGVFVPLVDEPEEGGTFAFSAATAFFSSASFFVCSSFRRSASESEESLYMVVSDVEFEYLCWPNLLRKNKGYPNH